GTLHTASHQRALPDSHCYSRRAGATSSISEGGSSSSCLSLLCCAPLPQLAMGCSAATEAALRVAAAALAVTVLAGVASAAVYEVGDKIGWTIMGNPNYTAWAASKTFHKNDVVVFTYNKQFHNVMAVSKADYKNCDPSKPIATWSTGNDSVVLNTTGHHYFLCGFPGHCGIGQKVDIRVASSSAASSPAPAPGPSGSGSNPSGGATAAPSPHHNAAPNALLPGGSVAATVAASLLSLAAAVLA
ncbi:unnamed protein product, partial [Urochloa humidicola]